MDKKIEYGIYEYNKKQIQIIIYPIINNSLRGSLYVAKECNYEYTSLKNGNITFTNEKERVFNLLNKGEGVIYKNKIIFATKNSCLLSLSHIQFKNLFNKESKRIEKDVLSKYVKDVSYITMIKSFIKMYKDGIFDKEKISNIISKYFIDPKILDKILEKII